jgi:hypothetical protein
LKKDLILFDLDGTCCRWIRIFLQKLILKNFEQNLPVRLRGPESHRRRMGGNHAMVRNTGGATNENLFWEKFSSLLGANVTALKDEFTHFYTNEFHRVKQPPTTIRSRQKRYARRIERLTKWSLPRIPSFRFARWNHG